MNDDERAYEAPAVEHRDPVSEPLIGGSVVPSPQWRRTEDDDATR